MNGEMYGYAQPVTEEIEGRDLPVIGTLPPELVGRYVRNGPNPTPGTEPAHLLGGQGMVHGLRLDRGRAVWYRNRWVRTGAFFGAAHRHADGNRDLSAVSGNTHVIAHAGRILALVESGLPHCLTPELDTVGAVDFDGALTTPMTAHPKRDPRTGELHFFGYAPEAPFLTYHRLSANGCLAVSRHVEVPGSTMMHDFAITANHVVWLDLPMTYHPELIGYGVPYAWDDAYGARLGIMRQDDADARVRWFDVDPCYVFHVGGAYEDEAGRIVVDAVRYDAPTAIALSEHLSGTASRGSGTVRGSLYRWVVDTAAGGVFGKVLDEEGAEFPTLDESRVGLPSRYRYVVSTSGKSVAAIAKYDLARDTAERHELGADVVAGEAVFVPATEGQRREDDGWLLTIVTRRDGSASRFIVLDASKPGSAPVAEVELPQRVPAGFHGSWIPDDSAGGTGQSQEGTS